MIRWLCVSVALCASLSAAAGPLTGRVTQQFVATPTALFLPTSVSVSSTGTVAVADGVNQRVVLFDAQGHQRRMIGETVNGSLDTPLSVRFDATDRLWIVDSIGQRIHVLDETGQLVTTQALTTDITDVVPISNDFWAIANNDHQITRFSTNGEALQTIGQRGSALGQFDYPYRAAVLPDGHLAVTDTINGRVVLVAADGTIERAISRYGVQLGELYRPKGIAIDNKARLWVSDSDLGVVQCFTATGEFVGVLRNENGDVLRFEAPHGLAFDQQNHLYVVELAAHRVVRVTIEENADNQQPPRPPQRINDQPRHCTACHLEWMAPLSTGEATALASVPENPPELPYASRSEVCLSCHDGSVIDDRRAVWREHGHLTGITPPESMTIASELPLVDGKLACRTCHSAHTRAGSGNVLRDAVFLRTEGPVTNMCTQCHDYADTQTHPGHPIGNMPIAMPEVLAREHDFESAPAKMTCVTCHVAHGSRDEALLTLPISDNSLCLTCHAELATNLFGPDHISKHGQLPSLTPEQISVAKGFNTRLGAKQQLLCVTCHQTHDAPRVRQLAFAPDDDTCSACHAEQRRVLDSPHDLRTTHSELVNRFGTKISQRGACAGCHGAHGAAFSPTPTKADPSGQCTSCHAPGGVVKANVLPEHNHPETVCSDCHNPHDNTLAHFLSTPAEQACLSCHTDHTIKTDSPHHIATNPAAWPKQSAETNDACLACHRPHGTEETGLWRVAAPASTGETRACLGCHPADGPDAALALQHPTIPADHPHSTPNTCAACHEPHFGVGQTLLNATSENNSAETCYRCHSEFVNIKHIGHGESYLAHAGHEATACQPCHVTHAPADAVQAYLRPAAWLKKPIPEEVPVSDRDCYVCHTPDGEVPLPRAVSHPQLVMTNLTPPDNPAFLPLFNAAGEVDRKGQIGCKTCHLTHGRTQSLPLPEHMIELNPREARAREWHLREFRVGNVCTTCHGEDALRRFMYYHQPSRRGGSVETGR